MVKIATPISGLFENKEHSKLLSEHSDCLECRDKSFNSILSRQEVFHCELQPIHKFTKHDFRYLEKLRQSKRDLKLLTFHIASSCDKPYIKNEFFYKRGKEYTEKEALKNARANFKKIKKIFDKRVEFAVENTNYYPTDAYKYITDPIFISRVVRENKINFLFDIAHSRITAHNKGIVYEEYRNSLPLDRVIQLHLSSFKISGNIAYDRHDYPRVEEFAQVRALLAIRTLKYVTVEYYKNVRYLLRALKILRGLL